MANDSPERLNVKVPNAKNVSDSIDIKKEPNYGTLRKDSIGWSADDFMSMITHTPPAFSPGSLTLPVSKRNRSGSISGRLLSASDLEEKGLIDRCQKGVLKVLFYVSYLSRYMELLIPSGIGFDHQWGCKTSKGIEKF
jgi:hypothetical protein